MGTGLLTPPTRRELTALAAGTGFRPDMIEKAVRLLALADRMPYRWTPNGAGLSNHQ